MFFFSSTTKKMLISLLGAFFLASALFFSSPAFAEEEKVFKLAVASDITSLDPHVQISEETLAYCHWVFDPLVRWNKEMKIEGRLAEKWELINKNTHRFYLRKGVKFHSGNEMTAKDVAWTLNRLKNSTEYKAIFEPISEAKIIDDYTIDFITEKPYGLVLNVATYIFVMDSEFYAGVDEGGQAKDFINKTGPSFANTNVSGTGPFTVINREQGITMSLRAFDGYWGDKGNVDLMIVTPIANDATRVASIISGDTDMIMHVPTQDYDRIAKDKKLQFVTIESTRIVLLQMNQKKSDELRKLKVREALVKATDSQAIVDKIMKGRTTVATQQIPKVMLGYNEELVPRYNLEDAKTALKESGYEKLEFTMIAPNNRYINDEKIAQAFVGMMAKLGVKIHLKTMPRTQYWDEYDAQVADIQMIGWHPDTEDAANYSEFLLMCPDEKTSYGLYNSSNYCNKKIDELILACQTETDQSKRAEMLKEVEKIAYDDYAFIPLHFEPYAWAAKTRLSNLEQVLNSMNFPYFGDLVLK